MFIQTFIIFSSLRGFHTSTNWWPSLISLLFLRVFFLSILAVSVLLRSREFQFFLGSLVIPGFFRLFQGFRLGFVLIPSSCFAGFLKISQRRSKYSFRFLFSTNVVWQIFLYIKCPVYDTKLWWTSSSGALGSVDSSFRCHYSQVRSDSDWLYLFGSHQWVIQMCLR